MIISLPHAEPRAGRPALIARLWAINPTLTIFTGLALLLLAAACSRATVSRAPSRLWPHPKGKLTTPGIMSVVSASGTSIAPTFVATCTGATAVPCAANTRRGPVASCTGFMMSTISPVPSTVAPVTPGTRASCGPMFFTTTSWLPDMSSTSRAIASAPARSSSTE